MKHALVFALCLLSLAACNKGSSSAGTGKFMDKATAGQDLYATVETNRGSFTVKLWSKEAPKTVANFVGLATGEKDWKHPATGEQKKGVPLYNGVVFHRVIPGFMIQGGDPLGSGRGNPGYTFEDETQNGRIFDRVGLLAMANAGPNTNGSQFFVTVSTPTYLNGKHTIFGEVVKGYDIVEGISRMPRDQGDRPVEPVIIKGITVSETP
ncbi:MAG: peptidylprolyl isomerase [Myxococcaceae bacterium]